MPLKDLTRNGNYTIVIHENEDFGVVMPTYWEGLPSTLLDDLKKAEFKLLREHHYIHFAATYGCDYGNILSTAQKEFAKKGIHFDSLYAARFVDNWSPFFDLANPLKNKHDEENGKRETAEIVKCVMHHEKGHTLPDQMTRLQAEHAKEEYNRLRHTAYFQVDTEKCMHCGLYERQCPVNAIEMQDGHPVWVKGTCTLCLGCFHRCPAGAIDYDRSLHNGQYVNPDAVLDDSGSFLHKQ